MNDKIDLHVHSNCSDGTCTPEEVVALAAAFPLRAIALTDHDTINGIARACTAGREAGVEVIPGIELSTNYRERDVHMLGLCIDTTAPAFLESLKDFQASRQLRNRKMIRKLQETGIAIREEDLQRAFPDCIWTRAHFGRFLFEHGYVSSISEAFARYIGDDAPCFIPREKVTPHQAVRLIHEGGGYAILAHPLLYHLGMEQLSLLVSTLADEGLDGLEALYSDNKGSDETDMRRLAEAYHLKITGGSDFHGANKPSISLGSGRGSLSVPYELLYQLRGH